MSRLDVRGFDYGLEPAVRRQRWRVAAQQMKLARVQDAIARCGAEQAKLEQTRRQCSEQARQRALAGIDVEAHRRTLLYLMQLCDRIDAGERMLSLLRQQQQAVQTACLELQRRLELLEQHRSDALAAYLRHLQQRHDSDMDRDWLARSVWRAAQRTESSDFEEKPA